MTFRHEAIRELYSNVKIIDDSTGAFDGNGNKVVIDENAVTTKVAELQADYDSKEYQRNRANEYPSMQDQLDMQYHDLLNNTTTWKDAIKAVKDKYPKDGG